MNRTGQEMGTEAPVRRKKQKGSAGRGRRGHKKKNKVSGGRNRRGQQEGTEGVSR